MTKVLLDTHAWSWTLTGDGRLSPRALAAIEGAEAVFVSPISFFEVAQKVRIGKWPEMVAFVEQLPSLLQAQGGMVAAFGPSICVAAGMMDWAHRDPFDRLLAATAREEGHVLVSADAVFDGIVTRVW